MIRFVTDSSSDMYDDEIEGVEFATVPLIISSDMTSFIDDRKLSTHRMIEYFLTLKGRSYTSCPSVEAWMDAFLCENGKAPDELYVVTLSGGVSGTYNGACVAAESFREMHPGTKVLVVDSLSIGPEIRLIIEKMVEMKMDGADFYEIEAMAERLKNHTRLFFAFKSLHNLVQNGRVSKVAAAAAGALGISVMGTASDEGKVESTGRGRGDKNVTQNFLKYMKDAGYNGGRVCIDHVENLELAEKIRDAIHEKYPKAEVLIYPVRGLCSYYCEQGGMLVACETE